MKITFEQLPDMVSQLDSKLDNILGLLHDLNHRQVVEEDQLLNIKQVSEFINLSVSTIYGLVHNKAIPVCKRGKRLYFSKSELLNWVNEGRKLTQGQIDQETDNFLSKLYNK